MPITAGTGSFNTGRDCQVVVVGALGRLDIPNITMFDAKPRTTKLQSKPLNGQNLNAELPDGWEWSIEADRGNAVADKAWAAYEAAWFTTGILPTVTVYQYVTEADGSQTTFQMDNSSFKLDNPGDWKADATVKLKISGSANRRVVV